MTYRAKHVTQKDGSSLQWQNCRMAVGATALDFHTEGSKTSTGASMRKRQTDMVGGTDAYDLQRSWNTYNEKLVIRNGKYWDDLLEDRKRGWFVSLDVWYAELPDRCQQAGNIGHTIGVAPETLDNGKWLVSDPLCSGYKWMVPSDLKRAAQTWGKRAGIGTAIMYTTAAEATEVSLVETINTNGMLQSTKRANVKAGADWFYNDECTDKAADFTGAASLKYVGLTKRGTYAVIVKTGRPYDDKQPRETVVYMKKADASIVNAPPDPEHECPECPGEADIIEARDAEWQAHLTPGRITTP